MPLTLLHVSFSIGTCWALIKTGGFFFCSLSHHNRFIPKSAFNTLASVFLNWHFVLVKTGGFFISLSHYTRSIKSGTVFSPTDAFHTRAGGAAVAVRQTLQLRQVHVLLDACVVGRVELLVAGGAGAGREVLHRGAHRVSAALRESGTRIRALAQPALLQKIHIFC
jgi:hypothetical protein